MDVFLWSNYEQKIINYVISIFVLEPVDINQFSFFPEYWYWFLDYWSTLKIILADWPILEYSSNNFWIDMGSSSSCNMQYKINSCIDIGYYLGHKIDAFIFQKRKLEIWIVRRLAIYKNGFWFRKTSLVLNFILCSRCSLASYACWNISSFILCMFWTLSLKWMVLHWFYNFNILSYRHYNCIHFR